MTPFKVSLGWLLKSPLVVFFGRTEFSVQSAQDLKTCLETALNDAQFSIGFAPAREATYNTN